jgi:hypothetical protein
LPENKYVKDGEYGNHADNQQSGTVTPHHDFPLSQPVDYHPGRERDQAEGGISCRGKQSDVKRRGFQYGNSGERNSHRRHR